MLACVRGVPAGAFGGWVPRLVSCPGGWDGSPSGAPAALTAFNGCGLYGGSSGDDKVAEGLDPVLFAGA